MAGRRLGDKGGLGEDMASLRNFALAAVRRAGYTNTAEDLRWASYNFTHPLTLLGLA